MLNPNFVASIVSEITAVITKSSKPFYYTSNGYKKVVEFKHFSNIIPTITHKFDAEKTSIERDFKTALTHIFF